MIKIVSRIDNLETIVKPTNLQKAYYGINGTLYSFDGKTFSNVLTLTNADVDTPNYISGMSLLCTINGLSYFNINGKIYSFDGSIFVRADTLLLPDRVTPNNVTSRSFIGVI